MKLCGQTIGSEKFLALLKGPVLTGQCVLRFGIDDHKLSDLYRSQKSFADHTLGRPATVTTFSFYRKTAEGQLRPTKCKPVWSF